MDTWGFVLIIIGGGLYLATRKKNDNSTKFAILLIGIGIGIVIGAVGAFVIVSRALP